MTPDTAPPTEYTPSTDEVRRSWTDWNDLTSGHDGERFDRWLSAHDREVAARAWDEGAKAAREEDFLADDFVETPNPYRTHPTGQEPTTRGAGA